MSEIGLNLAARVVCLRNCGIVLEDAAVRLGSVIQ